MKTIPCKINILRDNHVNSCNIRAINVISVPMKSSNYLRQFPELDEYTVEAADGHFMDHALDD
jgi:hypothetical protein